MKKTVQATSAILAITAGTIVLIGYFLPFDLPFLNEFRGMILQWVVLLTGIAVLAGVFNLVRVHSDKILSRRQGYGNSLALLISLVVTLVLVGYFGPTSPVATWIYKSIQIPIEVSLMALLVVILVFSGARFFSRRPTIYTVMFMVSVILCLVGMGDWSSLPINLHQLRGWLIEVPVSAGARGLLLGIALGSIATGMRILFGSDRPYQGQ